MNSPSPSAHAQAPRQVRLAEPGKLQAALAGVADRSIGNDSRGRATFREFLGLLGHELRNPLAPLQNAIYILERADLDAPAARILEMMDRQVQTLTRLVDDLLDASHHFEEPPGEQRERIEPEDSPAPRRVLVVDDNCDAAESLAELLRLHEFEVTLASSAEEALETAARQNFDTVVLDIGLPDRDGYALARELRARPEGGGYRLIALSGYGQDDDRRRSREAGIDHHLTKPIEIGRILELLAEPAGKPKSVDVN